MNFLEKISQEVDDFTLSNLHHASHMKTPSQNIVMLSHMHGEAASVIGIGEVNRFKPLQLVSQQ